jgi:hypothetical protein
VWEIHRDSPTEKRRKSMTEQRICTRCVLTEGTPGIEFDEDGICNYCRDYKSQQLELLGEAQLVELLERFKQKNRDKEYDCMIGVSGGRDSTYAMYKLVHDYGMRILGIHYDNPFTSPQAKENMERAAEILGVKILKWQFPPGEHVNATKKAIKVWARNPSSRMIPVVCAHCKNWWPTIFTHARENDVSLIVIGSNPLETASFKRKGFGGARTYHKITNLPRIIRGALAELFRNPGYLTLDWGLILSMYRGASHSSRYLRRRYRDISVIRLFDYLRWDEETVEETIKRELGWQKSAEVESSWRFDCRLDYLRRVMYSCLVGVTELRDLFSKMIREGMLSRDEALDRLSREDRVDRAVAESVAKDIGVTLSEVGIDSDTPFLSTPSVTSASHE